MTELPAARPQTQDASGGKPPGSRNQRVRIVNPVLNQSPKIRRKDADRLVQLKRAEWVALDQLRLILSHPTNKLAAERAAAGYEQIPPDRFLNREHLRHVPMVCVDKAIARTERYPGHRTPAGRSGPVRILAPDTPPVRRH